MVVLRTNFRHSGSDGRIVDCNSDFVLILTSSHHATSSLQLGKLDIARTTETEQTLDLQTSFFRDVSFSYLVPRQPCSVPHFAFFLPIVLTSGTSLDSGSVSPERFTTAISLFSREFSLLRAGPSL